MNRLHMGFESHVDASSQEGGVIYVYDGRYKADPIVFVCDGPECPRLYFETVFQAQEHVGLDWPIVRVGFLDLNTSASIETGWL